MATFQSEQEQERTAQSSLELQKAKEVTKQQELKYQEEQAKRDHELKMLEAAKANDMMAAMLKMVADKTKTDKTKTDQ
jgi:hypothetical protein